MNLDKKIAIIGAGIAGLTAGIMLERLGFEVHVFESAEKVRGIGAGIGLASNAMKAFEYLNLDQGIKQISNHLIDFEITDSQKNILFETDTKRIAQNYQTENYVIHRADLHQFLRNTIQSPIHTNKKLIDFQQDENSVNLKFANDETQSFDYMLGADGVNSVVRQKLLPQSTPRYAGYWCWRSVVEIPDLQLHKGNEVWGPKGRFGISPLNNNRIYWYACINSNLNDRVPEFKLDELKNQFKDYFPFVLELLDRSKDEELISTPILDIEPIPSYHFNRVLLMGDAAHATTPNMGQGACMAIEDVAVLQDELNQNDWLKACSNFEKRRLKRTHYIIRKSKMAGEFAQSDNKIITFSRNHLMRILPKSLIQFQMKKLLEEDFMKI